MNINRRNFLLGSAAAAAVSGCAHGAMPSRPRKDGEPLNVACVGYGMQMWSALLPQLVGATSGYGAENQSTYSLPDLCRVTLVCDCDKVRAQTGAKHVDDEYAKRVAEVKAGKAFVKDANWPQPACRWCTDFRDVVKDPSIDLVVIATPDHWHAYIAVECMKAGKDVYCEKPLTYNVDESRKIIAAQAKYGRIFQCGSMQRSWEVFRTAVMVVRNGIIGDVMYVDANYGTKGKLSGTSHPMRFWEDPADAAKEGVHNPNVDWDMWLGPSMYRPYSNRLAPADYENPRRPGVHSWYPMFWRFDDQTGLGYNGDWGAHHLDIAQWGLDEDKGGPYRVIRSDEPHSTDLYHGGRRQWGMKMIFRKPYGDVELYHGPFGVWGTVFYGTKGVVAVNRGKIAVWLGDLVKPSAEVRKGLDELQDVSGLKLVAGYTGKDYGTDAGVKKDAGLEGTIAKIVKEFDLDNAKVQLYKSPNQVRNFVDCAVSRKPTISPAEVGARGAVLCQLCNMSYVYDTGFDWDPVKMDFANGTGKGISLKRDFCRNGWEVVV